MNPHFSQFDAPAGALLDQMTLPEKIGQMLQVDSAALQAKSDVQTCFLGSVLSGGNSDPDGGSSPAAWLAFVAEFKTQARRTRLGIPLLYGIDAVHGHNNVDGAVVFPHQIGLGATRDAGLVERAARVTAREMAGTGIRWAFSPCVAVPQDPRWGRTYEGYSDDTAQVARLGVAAVTGLQGGHLSAAPASILACAKHFIGDGATQNGTDQGDVTIHENVLLERHLPPYAAAIQAGVGSIMVSYNSWHGVKLHGHKYLLADVLKTGLDFQGFLVSDWAAIDQITPDYRQAIARAINAGLDMVMIPNGPGKPNNYLEFLAHLDDLVAGGTVPLARINDAVRRILRVKFAMGLFTEAPPDPALTAAIGSPEHRAVARECVRRSLVLLQNHAGCLPLRKNLRRITVTGPAADDLGIQCGGWTMDWQGGRGAIIRGGTTLLAALRQTVSAGATLHHSPDGLSLGNPDVVIVALGELPYAEMKGDRERLELAEEDRALVARARATGAPVVTIIFSGRPLDLGAARQDSDALVAAWLPGTEGLGLTDALFGDHPFIGMLPRPWPGF